MRNLQLKKIAVALSLGAAVTAHAAGLGTMTSNSKLGEPLNAEIELLAVTPAELSSLQAVLASEQVYQDQMLEKPASYPFIKIEVGNNIKGQPVLKLSSSQPITEAFLDMLIQVDWPTGRLVKEYTLLLDPPGFNSNYVAESSAAPVVPTAKPTSLENNEGAGQPPMVAPEPKPEAKSKPVANKPAANKPDTKEATQTAEALTTERGDTLYAIARQMKPEHVSTEQMLAALYQSNQQAFDGKNMNRLKVGKIMRMPDQAMLQSLSHQQAKKLVAEHTADWLAYKNALGKVVKEAAPTQTGGNTQQSAGKIGAADAKPAPAVKSGKDVLKLSAGDEKPATPAGKPSTQASTAAAQEEATAKANAIKEEQSRAAALEKQVADMKKLMEMKNSAMADAEKNASQAAANHPVKPAETAPTVTPPAAVKSESPAVQVQPADKPSAQKASTEKPAEATKPAPVPDAALAPVQPSFMHVLLERLKTISPVLPWALLALPVLLCAWALIRIRRKKQIDNFEDVIVTSPATELQNNTVFGDTQAAAAGDTSFLTDFSQSGVGGMIDSHDVDPIAEAEVYMAYGRDAQAEEILKDAIQKDPQRQELKLKLLEIYQATNNKVAFESLASDLYTKVDPADAVWAKVSALGQKLDPENSLYQVNGQVNAAATSEPVADVDDTALAAVAGAPAEEEAYHFNFEAPPLDFNTENEQVSATQSGDAVGDEARSEGFVVDAGDDVSSPVAEDTVNAEADALPEDQGIEASVPPEQAIVSDALSFDSEPLSSEDSAPDLKIEAPLALPTEGAQADESTVSLVVDDLPDVAMSPKSLDLPSLNLDDGSDATPADVRLSAELTSGEQGLSSEDAVFESLPELSLELGGPNDTQGYAGEEGAIDIEEITLDEGADPLNVTESTPSAAEDLTFPEISLEVSEPLLEGEDGLAEESEEVNTKLDLIQAYIDMEDYIGAKELIEEVQGEGGERQRLRATELLAKLP